MKYAKFFGLLAVAATAMMALTATASATTVTAPTGTAYTGEIKATDIGNLTLHGVATVNCNESSFEGTLESHGSGVTAKGKITKLTFASCNSLVTVLATGTLEAHTTETHNATLTSSGAQVTVTMATIFGPVHCIFVTSNTHIGTITAANTNPDGSNHAILHSTSPIPVDPNTNQGGLCGGSANWTATYTIETPKGLTFDA